jgi:hypothetical protein
MSASTGFLRLLGSGNAVATDHGEHVDEQDPQARETGGDVFKGNFMIFGNIRQKQSVM